MVFYNSRILLCQKVKRYRLYYSRHQYVV